MGSSCVKQMKNGREEIMGEGHMVFFGNDFCAGEDGGGREDGERMTMRMEWEFFFRLLLLCAFATVL